MYTIKEAARVRDSARGRAAAGAATEVAGSLVLPDSIVAAADHAVALLAT